MYPMNRVKKEEENKRNGQISDVAAGVVFRNVSLFGVALCLLDSEEVSKEAPIKTDWTYRIQLFDIPRFFRLFLSYFIDLCYDE